VLTESLFLFFGLFSSKKKKVKRGGVAQALEHLPSRYKTLNSTPSTAKKKKKKKSNARSKEKTMKEL
jgi:hypothetical protein